MGRTVTTIKVENLGDVLLAERQGSRGIVIRSIETEALVDTGATLLCLPSSQIAALGLSLLGHRQVSTANGVVERRVYQGARLTILGRTCTIDALELPEGIPALVGYFPLENLDLQVDPKGQELIPNPAHGDKIVLDLYSQPLASFPEGP